jgi:hypothetical protein
MDSNYYGDDDNLYRMGGNSSNGFSSSSLDHIGTNGNNDKYSSILNGLDSPYSSLTANSHPQSHRGSNAMPGGLTLRNLMDGNGGSSNNYDMGIISNNGRPSNGSLVPWSNGDSHDSGIGNSPPFDSLSSSNGIVNGLGNGLHNNSSNNGHHDSLHLSSINGIWGDLSRALGGLDLSGGGSGSHMASSEKPFLNVGSRSSLDLGTLGRPLIGGWGGGGGSGTPTTSSSANSSSLLMSGGTANNHHHNTLGGGGGGHGSNGHYMNGALDSLPSSRSSTTTEPSPPNSLPFNLHDHHHHHHHQDHHHNNHHQNALDQMVCHALDTNEEDSSASLEDHHLHHQHLHHNNANAIPENVAFCSSSTSSDNTPYHPDEKAPLSCAGDFLSFGN